MLSKPLYGATFACCITPFKDTQNSLSRIAMLTIQNQNKAIIIACYYPAAPLFEQVFFVSATQRGPKI